MGNTHCVLAEGDNTWCDLGKPWRLVQVFRSQAIDLSRLRIEFTLRVDQRIQRTCFVAMLVAEHGNLTDAMTGLNIETGSFDIEKE
jgi:hypothetical protein